MQTRPAMGERRAVNSNDMSVYVVQDSPRKNLTKAQQWGDVRLILPFNSNIAFDAKWHIAEINRALEDYEETDYLVPIGDPAAIGIASHIILSRIGKLTYLKWDNRDMDYYPVLVDMRGELSNGEKGKINQRVGHLAQRGGRAPLRGRASNDQ